jgi:hypothetical protein
MDIRRGTKTSGDELAFSSVESGTNICYPFHALFTDSCVYLSQEETKCMYWTDYFDIVSVLV